MSSCHLISFVYTRGWQPLTLKEQFRPGFYRKENTGSHKHFLTLKIKILANTFKHIFGLGKLTRQNTWAHRLILRGRALFRCQWTLWFQRTGHRATCTGLFQRRSCVQAHTRGLFTLAPARVSTLRRRDSHRRDNLHEALPLSPRPSLVSHIKPKCDTCNAASPLLLIHTSSVVSLLSFQHQINPLWFVTKVCVQNSCSVRVLFGALWQRVRLEHTATRRARVHEAHDALQRGCPRGWEAISAEHFCSDVTLFNQTRPILYA